MGGALYMMPKYYRDAEVWSGKAAIPWGIMVPTYAYFALIATGTSTLNALYTVFGYKGPNRAFEKVLKHLIWFSLITLIPAWTPILSDLGRLDHFLSMITGFNPSSRIAWMGALYVFFFIMVLIELVFHIRLDAMDEERKKILEGSALALTISILTLIADLALDGNLGSVFGASTGVPAWSGAYVAVLFVILAILMGAAWDTLFLLGVYGLRGQLTRDIKEFIAKIYSYTMLVTIPATGFVLSWEAITSLDYPMRWEFFRVLTSGHLGAEFEWIVIFLGFIVTYLIAIAAYKLRSATITAIASLILVFAGYALVYDFVIGGQVARLSFGGLDNINPYHIRFWPYHYHWGVPELSVLTGGIALWLFLLILGEILLPLEEGEKPKHLWIFR
jgi:Ni/Fe-hydrogenase subunit HybB-like protein